MTIYELKEQYGHIIEIGNSKSLYEEMSKEEEKHRKLKELAFNDFVNTVKHNINYFDYLCYIPASRDYFFKKDNKDIDKRSKEFKENKAVFKILEKNMNKWFEHDVKIVDFRSGGYEGYYEEIIFTVQKRKFSLTIPVATNINKNNFSIAYEGKLAFGEYLPDNFTHEIIETSYMFEDILKAFKNAVL